MKSIVASMSNVEAVLYPRMRNCLDSTHAFNSQRPMYIDLYLSFSGSYPLADHVLILVSFCVIVFVFFS